MSVSWGCPGGSNDAIDPPGIAAHAALSRWMYSHSCTRRMSLMLAEAAWASVETPGGSGGDRIPKMGEVSTCRSVRVMNGAGGGCCCVGLNGTHGNSVGTFHCVRASDVIQAARTRDDEGGGGGGVCSGRRRRGRDEAKRNAGESIEKRIGEV